MSSGAASRTTETNVCKPCPKTGVPVAGSHVHVGQVLQSAESQNMPEHVKHHHARLKHRQTQVDEALMPVLQQIMNCKLKLITMMHNQGQCNEAELRKLADELVGLEQSKKKDGIWCGNLSASQIPKGQAVVEEELQEAHGIERAIIMRMEGFRTQATQQQHMAQHEQQVHKRQTEVDQELIPILNHVMGIKKRLISMLHNKSEQNVDELRRLGGQLVELEQTKKKDGVWGGDLQNFKIPKGQGVMQEEMEECHGIERAILMKMEGK